LFRISVLEFRISPWVVESLKYVIVIPCGAADEPLEDLDGRTPLEAAKLPHADALAREGRLGTVRHVPAGDEPQPHAALLSMLGYDPREEAVPPSAAVAAGLGIAAPSDETLLVGDFVTIIDGVLEDDTAGRISTEEAWAVIEHMRSRLGEMPVRFHRGRGHRHLLSFRNELTASAVAPSNLLGQPVAKHRPRGEGAEVLTGIREAAREILAASEINAVRADLGENPATDLWLWGGGKPRGLESFQSRFGLRGVCVAGSDVVRGLCALSGWMTAKLPGGTGETDTDLSAKGSAAIGALDAADLVLVHVEATHRASSRGEAEDKLRLLEAVDEKIVGPLHRKLRSLSEPWRMMLCPALGVSCRTRRPIDAAVPFVIAGQRMEHVHAASYDESAAESADLHIDNGANLMEFFLTVR
jgi:2,3-bisphosphoglycerate-independent phosphoglycerate mutase